MKSCVRKCSTFLYKSNFKSYNSLIKIDYNQLINPEINLSEEIHSAFGKEGLGLMAIKNIPNYEEIRYNILSKGFDLANLEENYLKSLERPEASYMIGWSKAKAFTENDYEYLTGAFYARTTKDCMESKEDPEFAKKYKNVWPAENKLLNFKNSFIRMGQLMTDCQIHMLKHLDRYIYKVCPQFKENSLFNSFSKNNDSVSRFIIYYPPDTLDKELIKIKGEKIKKKWTGWHRDFGVITALTHPLYFNKKKEIVKDIKSALLIEDKKHNITDVIYEENEMVVQTGDISFILSGGNIVATPHSVKVTEGVPEDVYRIQFVNFLEPYFDYKIFTPGSISVNEIFDQDPFKNANVFTKFEQGISYKDFILSAMKAYYIDLNKLN